MFIISGDEKFTIIQGDDVSIECEPQDSFTSTIISEIWFSCKMCEIDKQFVTYGTSYLVSFSSAETELFKAGIGTYDVTLKTTSGDIKTILHNGKLEVLAKENVVSI